MNWKSMYLVQSLTAPIALGLYHQVRMICQSNRSSFILPHGEIGRPYVNSIYWARKKLISPIKIRPDLTKARLDRLNKRFKF